MQRLFTAIALMMSSPLALAGSTAGYVIVLKETQSVPVLSPVGLAGLAVVVSIGAARVLRNRRNR